MKDRTWEPIFLKLLQLILTPNQVYNMLTKNQDQLRFTINVTWSHVDGYLELKEAHTKYLDVFQISIMLKDSSTSVCSFSSLKPSIV